MKYGVNRVTLVGNVGEVPRVTERDGEAFVANFPLATNEVWKDKEGEEVSKTEWHRNVYMSGTFNSIKGHNKTQKINIIVTMFRFRRNIFLSLYRLPGFRKLILLSFN
jgi:single stranded DNA-binding protein